MKDVKPDFSGLEKVFSTLVEGFGKFAKTLGEVGAAFINAFAPVAKLRAQQIALHGPHNEDADGNWQTDICAGWLHTDCPSPEFCDCHCHD